MPNVNFSLFLNKSQVKRLEKVLKKGKLTKYGLVKRAVLRSIEEEEKKWMQPAS